MSGPRESSYPYANAGYVKPDGGRVANIGVLAYRELFRGSVHGSAVHPREVVKEALKDRSCIWGGVNAPVTVGMGSPEDIDRAAQYAVETLGPEGFILNASIYLCDAKFLFGALQKLRLGKSISLALAGEKAQIAFTYNSSAAAAQVTLGELQSLGVQALPATWCESLAAREEIRNGVEWLVRMADTGV